MRKTELDYIFNHRCWMSFMPSHASEAPIHPVVWSQPSLWKLVKRAWTCRRMNADLRGNVPPDASVGKLVETIQPDSTYIPHEIWYCSELFNHNSHYYWLLWTLACIVLYICLSVLSPNRSLWCACRAATLWQVCLRSGSPRRLMHQRKNWLLVVHWDCSWLFMVTDALLVRG